MAVTFSAFSPRRRIVPPCFPASCILRGPARNCGFPSSIATLWLRSRGCLAPLDTMQTGRSLADRSAGAGHSKRLSGAASRRPVALSDQFARRIAGAKSAMVASRIRRLAEKKQVPVLCLSSKTWRPRAATGWPAPRTDIWVRQDLHRRFHRRHHPPSFGAHEFMLAQARRRAAGSTPPGESKSHARPVPAGEGPRGREARIKGHLDGEMHEVLHRPCEIVAAATG